jgi:hypothetical protein
MGNVVDDLLDSVMWILCITLGESFFLFFIFCFWGFQSTSSFFSFFPFFLFLKTSMSI